MVSRWFCIKPDQQTKQEKQLTNFLLKKIKNKILSEKLERNMPNS